MEQHSYLLCLGSNFKRHIHLAAARDSLQEQFTNILFGEEMETEAIGNNVLSPFSNQLAKLQTDLSLNDVSHILKEIEIANGRLVEDKAQGIVKLDIDILLADSSAIKPDDLKRDYIIRGMESLDLQTGKG